MTAKQRNKNNIIDNNSHSNQDDVAKKASQGSEERGSVSGSWAKVLAVLCYIILVAAAGSAALYFQRVLEEMGQLSRRTEETMQKNAELASRLESVLHQVDSLRTAVDGFEPTLVSMRAELGGVSQALRRGEEEAQRAEEYLQELQGELLQELSRGLQEVEEARGRDSAARERGLEERLGELTRSMGASVAQVTEAQGHAQVQIGDLRARLDGLMDPAPIKQELLVVTAAVAELRAANQRAETSADSLRDQISDLGAELQTTNQKVSSVARKAESVRALAQSVAGELEQSVSAVETSVQALSDQALSLRAGLEQAQGSVQSAAQTLRETEVRGERLGAELGARLGAAEEAVDALRVSAATQAAGLDSLLSRSDSQENALAVLARDLQSTRTAGEEEVAAVQAVLREAAQARSALGGQVEALQSDVGQLWSAAAILNSTQAEQSLRDASLTLQLDGLSQRLAAVGEAVRQAQASNTLKAATAQQNLRQLMTSVDSLLTFSDRVKGHVDAIASLQNAVEETNASVSAMSKKYKVPSRNV
ncbi:myosin-9-like [Anguilla anguilla]|uniref:myosin-9-like n=1 Tax=Anguilla anguilla TaxID=7936 RepID=UPI0015B294A7|nr:myosin-9-like [Anguilla anguilla]